MSTTPLQEPMAKEKHLVGGSTNNLNKSVSVSFLCKPNYYTNLGSKKSVESTDLILLTGVIVHAT